MKNLHKLDLPEWIIDLFESAKSFKIYNSHEELYNLAINGEETFDVKYPVDGKEFIEAQVARVRNGLSVNYTEPYMRRRDPDCLLVADTKYTDKERFRDRFGYDFEPLRSDTFKWLKEQDLAIFFFKAGNDMLDTGVMVVAPANAGFFSFGLSLLQGIVDLNEVEGNFNLKGIAYVAPPFRHTCFDGKQVVVHNRRDDFYELFSFNLYPGPSAKKGVYGMLIQMGEEEGWVATHCSTAQILSPYDNITTFMHEGASGGGKSEMLQTMHIEDDGRVTIGKNTVTGQEKHIPIPQACKIMPVSDDMALCHPKIQKNNGRVSVVDGESAWFVRVNHINGYGKDHMLERVTIHAHEKLMFISINAEPDSTALIWEHTEDEPGVPCPNPRVILPRKSVPNSVNKPVSVDVRSFGVRTPPCTKEKPTYGIIGIFHTLPPALAWLWRLVSPRGHGNPSIVDKDAMGSEGVGSYWPFATGSRIKQANLLLDQFVQHNKTLYTLTPNQHVGAWECGFFPQWIMREYLTRRGSAKLSKNQYKPARFSLLGYELNNLTLEGVEINEGFLKVYMQPEVGVEGYDAGAIILHDFFKKQLKVFDSLDLAPTGKKIIECFLDKGQVEDYQSLI